MKPDVTNTRIPAPTRRTSKWVWGAVLAATAVVVACEGNLTFPGQNATWGFITVAASKTATGQYRTTPVAQFFKGSLSSVPNAQIVFDSCVPGLAFSDASEIVTGVTFLDAGPQVTLLFGTKLDTLPRISGAINTTYQRGALAPINYNPGDSLVVSIPGASGGYPAAEIRGKTAEPFTNDAVVAPTGTETIQFKWTTPTDLNSAMIVSMRYARSQDAGRVTQQVLCAFTDDGADSVPYRNHRGWSDVSNTKREVVFTRLRTSIISQNDGVLEIISRFQSPTPAIN